ncbi:MAG: DUF1501 domain-containing protein [Myxococcales bacterium]|nr:DUF1501 domain-containing protein [Myxococcales bacterium]
MRKANDPRVSQVAPDAPGFSVSRRRVLGSVAGAIGSASVGFFGFEKLARADLPMPSGRAFIFCYFPGGWDQLLFLDPRDPARFPDSDRSVNLFETRYQELEGVNGFSGQLVRPRDPSSPLAFGPAAAKPADMVKLTDFADRIAVVRGMNMNTLGHEVGYRYFLTGKFPVGTTARGTSIATEIVAQMVPRRPIPNVSLRVESYNDRYSGAASALRVDTLDDLLLVLAPSRYQERDVVERALADYGQRVGPCDPEVYDRRGLFSAMRGARSQADSIVQSGLAQYFQFVSGTDEASQAIRRRYRLTLGDANSPGARAALAAQAIKTGVAQVASVMIGNSTDTHFTGNAGHAAALYPGVSAFTSLLDDLRSTPHPSGGTFLDHTTVLGFSEFSRTPMFNNFGGRDHHLTGSCILAGAGIRGNTVIAESSNVGMAPARYDFARNVVAPTGENILPEHIAATLLASAGLDPYITRVNPIQALLAPNRS